MNKVKHISEIQCVQVLSAPNEDYSDLSDKSDGGLSEIDFPIPELPECLRDCVTDCRRVYGVEPDLPTIIGLGVVSTALGKSVALRSGTHTTYPNLYALASAPSGAGKSSTFRPFTEPLYKIERELIERHARRLPELEAEKDLLEIDQKNLLKSKSKTDQVKEKLAEIKTRLAELKLAIAPPQLIAEDATVEALLLALAANGETLGVLSPDGSAIITNWLGRYNKTDRTDESIFLKSWSLEPCRVNRVSRKALSLSKPCMSLVLCCTPDEVRNLFASDRFTQGGLLPRILICESQSFPKERNGESLKLNQSYWNQWKSLIEALYALRAGDALQVEVTSDARAQFDKAHNAFCRNSKEQSQSDSFAARRVEQGMRIALCLHALEHGDTLSSKPLTAATAATAIKLAEYYGQAGERFKTVNQYQYDQQTIARIRQTVSGYGGNNEIQISQLTRRNGLRADEVKALAKRNPQVLKIETRKPEGAGRPSEVVILTS